MARTTFIRHRQQQNLLSLAVDDVRETQALIGCSEDLPREEDGVALSLLKGGDDNLIGVFQTGGHDLFDGLRLYQRMINPAD